MRRRPGSVVVTLVVVLAACGSTGPAKEAIGEIRANLVEARAIGTWRCTHNEDQVTTVAISDHGTFRIHHTEPDASNELTLDGTWKLNGSRLVTRYAGSADGSGTIFNGIPRDPDDGATLIPGDLTGESYPDEQVKVTVRGSTVTFEVQGPDGPARATCTKTSSADPDLPAD